MPDAAAPRAKLIAAFAAVYTLWGSTYLAIRFAIETLPPFLMAGLRFVIAGGLLYAWSRVRGAARPERAHWASAAIVGGLLLLGGNGGVVWSEQLVPSGLTALLVTTVPLWMVLLEWVRPSGTRPTAGIAAGLALGFAGVALLVGPANLAGGEPVHPLGAAVLLVASASWATGSLYSRRAPLPQAPLLAAGMQMLAGGALLLAAGTLSGEWARVDLPQVSARSWASLAYLIVFGSLVGFTSYLYLLRATTPARAATYAYVNPVVAVLLGWALAGEPLSPRVALAAAMIVAAVALITTPPAARPPRHPAAAAAGRNPGPSITASLTPKPEG